MLITITVLHRPEPQGSVKAFILPGVARSVDHRGKVSWIKPPRAILTSDNDALKPYRAAVAAAAHRAMRREGIPLPMAEKQIPVKMTANYYFERPASVKKREHPTVRPDLDKLLRATKDALASIAYVDDAQVIDAHIRKHYGFPERVEITLELVSAIPTNRGVLKL